MMKMIQLGLLALFSLNSHGNCQAPYDAHIEKIREEARNNRAGGMGLSVGLLVVNLFSVGSTVLDDDDGKYYDTQWKSDSEILDDQLSAAFVSSIPALVSLGIHSTTIRRLPKVGEARISGGGSLSNFIHEVTSEMNQPPLNGNPVSDQDVIDTLLEGDDLRVFCPHYNSGTFSVSEIKEWVLQSLKSKRL